MGWMHSLKFDFEAAENRSPGFSSERRIFVRGLFVDVCELSSLLNAWGRKTYLPAVLYAPLQGYRCATEGCTFSRDFFAVWCSRSGAHTGVLIPARSLRTRFFLFRSFPTGLEYCVDLRSTVRTAPCERPREVLHGALRAVLRSVFREFCPALPGA